MSVFEIPSNGRSWKQPKELEPVKPQELENEFINKSKAPTRKVTGQDLVTTMRAKFKTQKRQP